MNGEVDKLRKVMLLAAMLAMVLAAAAPAFSQTAATLQYSCDQIQAQIGAGATVSQQQVLACFGQAAALQDSTVNVDVGGTATAAGGGGGGGGAAATAAGGALPATGGASLLAIGAGVLLVTGGLLARRIVR
jgi:hypothetical protein